MPTSASTNEFKPCYLFTVPHSATRFVHRAFPHCGLQWNHHGFITDARLKTIARRNRCFTVLRDPLATFVSHVHKRWGTTDVPNRERLRQIYAAQQKSITLGKVFSIEHDGIQAIGDWIGKDPDVPVHGTGNSGAYPLKTAVEARDEYDLEQLLGDDWRWFKEVLTPEIAAFYTKYGYDLWWTNG
jgi:hypothetical protein